MQSKKVILTGGTGSFGQAMTKELLTKDVSQIRVFSRDELKQHQMAQEFNDGRLRFICGDVRDADQLTRASEGCDILIHAAAMKRIEKCEVNPSEAVKTNILGTSNVIKACLDNNIAEAVLISTDKAVYPVNIYGATKLTAEKLWIQSNVYRGTNHPTKFCVVRYGNVLGSRGSVVQIFREQAKRGAIKITDASMTRFFITLQEAVDLVQLAIEFQQGGEIFVPNLKAASIQQLAKAVSGTAPIEVTSQRGGEKLHESLVTEEEKNRLVSFKHHSVINPEVTTWPFLPWRSELRLWARNSKEAAQYTDKELKALLASI